VLGEEAAGAALAKAAHGRAVFGDPDDAGKELAARL